MNTIISIEPGVSAQGWSRFYTDAIKALQPGISEMIVHLAYDDEEMRGLTLIILTGGLNGVSGILSSLRAKFSARPCRRTTLSSLPGEKSVNE